MTISTTTASQTFACDGTTTAFSFTFIGVSPGVLSLTQTATGGAETVINPSAYTIALNAPAAGQLWGIGGTVTYPLAGAPIAAGNSLTLARDLPNTQLTAVAANGPAFQAIEVGLDTLAMQIQDLAAGTEPIPVDPTNILPGDNIFTGNNTFTGIAAFHRLRVAVRVIIDPGDVTVSATADYFIAIDKTIGEATAVNLPAGPAVGDTYLVKDLAGDSATHNITVVPASGLIDGGVSFVIASAFQSSAFTYTGDGFWAVN